MKRGEESNYSFNCKRAKLAQDIDDIWGDDPEIEEIDKCINMATQCFQTSRPPNTLNLTSYDDFKCKPNMCSSTQSFVPPVIASTSGFVTRQSTSSPITISSGNTNITRNSSDEEIPKLLRKNKVLESENKKLKDMYETKNGEITILRSQLKQVQNAMDNEKMEKLRIGQENQQKWNVKLNNVIKESSGLKCEVELKNLEIANLRDKLGELKKVYNSNLNITILNEEFNGSQVGIARNKINGAHEQKKLMVCKNIQTEFTNISYPAASVTNFSIENLIPISIFEKSQEKCCIIKLKNINTISILSHKSTFLLKSEKISETFVETDKNNLICVNNLHSDLQKLIKCSKEELNNCPHILNFIENICNSTKKSLLWLLHQLSKINDNLTYDYVESMNKLYLKQNEIQYHTDCIFSGNLWHEHETAVEIRRYVAILAQLVCHSEKLRKNCITLTEIQMETDHTVDNEFLKMLLKIVSLIKNIKRCVEFCGLLSAIVKLITNLSLKETLPFECYDIIYQIFIQIIFSRPNRPVLKYICYFLNKLSRHNSFIVKLCNLKTCETSKLKDGLLFLSEDSCGFRILSTNLETCELMPEMASDVIRFLINSVTCNEIWIYHQEEQRCDCLVEIYNLGIDVLFNTLKKKSNDKDETKINLHYTIFQNGLIFLDILNARIPDIVFRCPRIFSQYHKIIKYISKIQKKLHLGKAHENALQKLMFQINYDAQKQSQIRNRLDRFKFLLNKNK